MVQVSGGFLLLWSLFVWAGYQGGHIDRSTFYVCATVVHAAWLIAAAIWARKS